MTDGSAVAESHAAWLVAVLRAPWADTAVIAGHWPAIQHSAGELRAGRDSVRVSA